MATETLRPSDSGTHTEFPNQYPSEGSHWDKVDEEESDNDGTYIKSATNNPNVYRDTYNLPFTSIPENAVIDSVTVHILARNEDSVYKGYTYTMLRTHSTDYLGSENQPPTSYTEYTKEYINNPNTGQPWTIEELNAMEIGVKGQSGFRMTPLSYFPMRCTQVFVVIEYHLVVTEPTVTTQDATNIGRD